MKITIDTKEDSHAEIQKVIKMLSSLVNGEEVMSNQGDIFDLDNTIICSKHRQACLPDGTLDLDHWKKNSTSEKIAKDTLLPCANMMQNAHCSGHTIIVCTARVIGKTDYKDYCNQLVFYFLDLIFPTIQPIIAPTKTKKNILKTVDITSFNVSFSNVLNKRGPKTTAVGRINPSGKPPVKKLSRFPIIKSPNVITTPLFA